MRPRRSGCRRCCRTPRTGCRVCRSTGQLYAATQHATCNVQRDVQRATCNVQRARYHIQRGSAANMEQYTETIAALSDQLDTEHAAEALALVRLGRSVHILRAPPRESARARACVVVFMRVHVCGVGVRCIAGRAGRHARRKRAAAARAARESQAEGSLPVSPALGSLPYRYCHALLSHHREQYHAVPSA